MVTERLRPRLTITLFGWRVHSFHAFGIAGAVLASAVALALALATGLSCDVALLLLATGLITFLVLARITKRLTGSEALVYYHHEIAVLLVSGSVLSVLGLPVLPYLDLNVIWLGIFMSCGRGGCLMAGCCHGKAHRWGVRYGAEHAREGFPACYVGVRLFPVQALESALMLCVIGVACSMMLQGRAPGTVLSTSVMSYAFLRFWLEELRGDEVRNYWWRLSEGQWTSLILSLATVAGEWRGQLPHTPWHAAAAGAILLSALMLGIAGRGTRVRGLTLARHAGEVARIVAGQLDEDGPIVVRETSLQVRISRQRIDAGGITMYCLSCAGRGLEAREAGVLARTIAALDRVPLEEAELLQGRYGAYHLILPRAH